MRKRWIIAYFVITIVIITGALVPAGYSIKDNKAETVSFTDYEIRGENVMSRAYQETYKIIAAENIQINNIQLLYSADDPRFKGTVAVSISDEEGVISSKSVNITSTGGENQYSAANLVFYNRTDAHELEVQLLKGHEYTLYLRVNTNMPNYSIKKFDISNQKELQFESGVGQSIISRIEYIPVEVIRYGELFYGFILLFILVSSLLLLKKLDFHIADCPIIKKALEFVRKYSGEIVLILMFIYLALYEFYYAYAKGTYISRDSSGYLMAAGAIKNGYGFNSIGESGYYSWYGSYPIGYPLLIAVVSFITGRNLYLSSKILSVLIVGVFLLLLYVKFRKQAWIYSFCLLNVGFLNIYKYTWSEIPFTLGLLAFCLIMDYIIENDAVKLRWYIFWGLSSAWLFLCRYFGTFSFIIIGLIWVGYMGGLLKSKRRDPALKSKVSGCTVSGLISGAVIGSYYLMNYIKTGTISGNRSIWWDEYSTLTDGFYSALIAEIANAFRFILPDPLASMSRHLQTWIVILFLAVIIYLFYKFKPKDSRAVFIGVGIFYYLVFVFIRYHSSMDQFGYRFFAPASILIIIGIIGFVAPFLNRNKNKIIPIVLCMLVLSVLGLCKELETFDRNDTEYSKLRRELENAASEIPEHSVVLGSNDLDYRTRVFRPDLYYVGGTIGPNDTMDALFERYGKSDYICIKAKYVKDILFYPIYDYDKSVLDFFDEVTENTPDEEFLAVSVKDRKLENFGGK